LQTAQGLTLTETWYWDLNDSNRAWTKRWQQGRGTGTSKWPSMNQSGVYASVLHYLKARAALGTNGGDGKAVVAKMKELPTDDPLFGKGKIEVNGRLPV
jgi:branched-chain amino acid transport system substrate-binding protein